MADSYIDAFECVVYGRLACEEMRRQAMPLHAAWAPAIEHAIELQEQRNAAMAEIVARLRSPRVDAEQVAAAGDTVVRFHAWLLSLKGRPLDPQHFFGGAVPSSIARRRLPKLAGQLEHIVGLLLPHAEGGPEGGERIPGAAARLAELREALDIATRERDAQRAARADRATLSPEAERSRLEWLATYVANKRLVEGILRHHDRIALMPVIFDDLAEVQRSKSPSDDGRDLEPLVGPGGGDPPPQP